AGFLAGVPVSIMATLDGFLSGLMGGMMGAMLGEMIVVEFRDAIAKIMFFLFLGTILILLRMMHKEVNAKPNVFHHPLITIIPFVLLFIVFELFDPIFPHF